jgi:hypothetical protein
MKYPTITEYTDALQASKLAILDSKLAAGRVEARNWDGAPFARLGQFALTFKITAGGRDHAFRCFQSERPSMRDRYSAISDAMAGGSLPGLVAFDYQQAGIRVGSQSFPAIRMDWATGVSLGSYVESNVRKPAVLRALQQKLHSLSMSLARAGIAHGDIQSNNILVGSDGTLTLVDYDGMFVPRIAKLGAIETGHRNFQHPERAITKPFDTNLDRFSFALLHTAVGALAERPGLWSEFSCDNDGLILRESDMADPGSSKAFTTLSSLPVTGVFAQRLSAMASAPYAATPTFDDFLAGRSIPAARITANSSRSARPTTASTSSTPWYLDQDGTPEPSSPANGSVADGSDRFQCLTWLGSRIELVGRVKEIKRGGPANSPYMHLILSTDGGGSVRIRLLTSTLRALIASKRTIDDSWVGSWVSATGIMRNDVGNGIASVTLSHTDDLTTLTSEQARKRLALASNAPTSLVSATSSTAAPTTNRERVASLGQKAGTTASASIANGGGGSSKRKIGELSVGPAIGVFVAVIAVVCLIIAIVVGSSSGSTGSSGAPAVAAPAAPAASAVPVETAAADMVGTCWAESAGNAELQEVECTDSIADFQATSAVDTSVRCTGESLPWDDGRFLCLKDWTSNVYETCFQPKGNSKACEIGLTWTYSYCYDFAEGIVLQQFIDGGWKTVKQLTSKKSETECTDSGFPYLVEFTRKAAGPGVKKYRLYQPETDQYFSAVRDTVTVTVSET